MNNLPPWFFSPSRKDRVKIFVHRLFCRRLHWDGYPDWMTDNFGHMKG